MRLSMAEPKTINNVRIDTENRCQSHKCNPTGKPKLLFMSAGSPQTPIQIKCQCGHMNTIWPNRIGFDEFDSLYMKRFRSEI